MESPNADPAAATVVALSTSTSPAASTDACADRTASPNNAMAAQSRLSPLPAARDLHPEYEQRQTEQIKALRRLVSTESEAHQKALCELNEVKERARREQEDLHETHSVLKQRYEKCTKDRNTYRDELRAVEGEAQALRDSLAERTAQFNSMESAHAAGQAGTGRAVRTRSTRPLCKADARDAKCAAEIMRMTALVEEARRERDEMQQLLQVEQVRRIVLESEAKKREKTPPTSSPAPLSPPGSGTGSDLRTVEVSDSTGRKLELRALPEARAGFLRHTTDRDANSAAGEPGAAGGYGDVKVSPASPSRAQLQPYSYSSQSTTPAVASTPLWTFATATSPTPTTTPRASAHPNTARVLSPAERGIHPDMRKQLQTHMLQIRELEERNARVATDIYFELAVQVALLAAVSAVTLCLTYM